MKFDDNDKFEPLELNCDVDDVKDVENNVGKLTIIVTYYTRYTYVYKLPILLSFGWGNEVAVNVIIGKPTLKEWEDYVDFNNDIFTSEEMMLQFDMEYKVADSGLSKMLYSIVLDVLDHILHFRLEHTLFQLIQGIILQLCKPNRMLRLQLCLIHMWMIISLDPSLHPKLYN